jgi:hypothetical protein
VRMIGDVAKLVVLIFFVLCAITSGTYILFASLSTASGLGGDSGGDSGGDGGSGADGGAIVARMLSEDSGDPLGRRKSLAGGGESLVDAACIDFYSFKGDWQHWGWTFFVLWNAAFTEEHYSACLIQSHPSMMWLVWIYSFIFSLATAVLLLNMLIAMMGKTIDNVWESSSTLTQFLFARLTINLLERPPDPPPFNVLRMPTYLVAFGASVVSHISGSSYPRQLLWSSFQYSPLLPKGSPLAVNVGADGEYVGTDWRGRNTFESFKLAWSPSRLSSFVDNFIVKREDTVANEGRWRGKMLKRMAVQFESLREENKLQNRKIEEVLEAIQNTHTSLAALTVAHSSGGVPGDDAAKSAKASALSAFGGALNKVRKKRSSWHDQTMTLGGYDDLDGRRCHDMAAVGPVLDATSEQPAVATKPPRRRSFLLAATGTSEAPAKHLELMSRGEFASDLEV